MQCYAFFSGLNTSNLYAILKLFLEVIFLSPLFPIAELHFI